MTDFGIAYLVGGGGENGIKLREWKCVKCYFLGVRSLALERVDLEGDSVALMGGSKYAH